MEILISSFENCFTDSLLPEDICNVFSACIVDWPCDSRAPWPCFFFAGCAADQ